MANVLTEEEQRRLEENTKRIGMIVDDIFSDGVPKENRDKRLALEAIETMNSSILKHAEIRKDAEEGSDEEVRNAVVAMVEEVRKLKNKPIEREIIDIPEEDVGEIHETALNMEKEELMLEDFVKGEDE